jgi:hypothetical protein
LQNPFTDLKLYNIDTYKNQITTIEYEEIKKYPNNFVRVKNLSDVIKIPCPVLIVYLTQTEILDRKEFQIPKRLFIYLKNENTSHLLICKIDILRMHYRGLTEFESTFFIVKDNYFEKEFLKSVFIDIRDLYHEHTHHDGDIELAADSLSTISCGQTYEDSIKDVIANFQEKIILYHKLIKFLLNKKGKTQEIIRYVVDYVRQAKAESIYALNFLNYYKENIQKDNIDIYMKIFENSLISYDMRFNEINSKYDAESTEKLNELTKDLKKISEWVYYATIALVILGLITIIFSYLSYVKTP